MGSYHSPYYNTLRGDEDELISGPPKPPAMGTKINNNNNKTSENTGKSEHDTAAPSRKRCKMLPDNLFRRALENCGLPRPSDRYAYKALLRDSVFPEISQLLVGQGKEHWSLSPRTFSILWVLNIPHVMDHFIAEGRTDNFIPYSEANLPDYIRGSLRSKFIQLQNVVRYKKDDVSKLEESGNHIHLKNADVYFFSSAMLGKGRFAVVDEVRSTSTTKVYARKRIFRGQSLLEDKNQLAAFERELESLKTLEHRHVVKLVGSYTDSTSLGLIMSPIADFNLYEHLNICEKDSASRRFILRSFFGCLTTALAYIHDKNVRHKDIKPANILVKGDDVFLADFGTSRICLDGGLTTNGVKEGTPRYWAPEVGDNANRNRSSDVWSLGCVFLEMATTLFGRTQDEMRAFYATNGSGNHESFSLNSTATTKWIQELRTSSVRDLSILDWTAWMLQIDPDDRPTAAQLRGKIIDDASEFDYICHECASPKGMLDGEPPASSCPTTAQLQFGSQVPLPRTLNGSAPTVPGEPTGTNPYPDSIRENQEKTCGETSDGDGDSDTTLTESSSPRRTAYSLTKADISAPRVRFADDIESSSAVKQKTESPIRFAGLPQDRRPEPTSHDEDVSDDEEEVTKDAEFIIPEPIQPPPFLHRDCLPLPRASLVPSYILAGTNHFSRNELEDSTLGSGTTNVFVYGRLMFPSVLHAIAAQSTAGAYSPDLQRRVKPSSDDWSKANLSIQRASEIMTPARLRGYDRWQPRGLQCAVLQKSKYTKEILSKPRLKNMAQFHPPGEVIGFLLVGVKKEAVRYLDLLFAHDERDLEEVRARKREEESGERDTANSSLRRESVEVDVELDNGEITQVEAHTYIWKHRTADLGQPWDEGHFLRGSKFQRLVEHENRWKAQEQALATRMHISFALVGDFMCSAVLTGNTDELQSLLDHGWDPDAPCRYYGNVLQAAVVTGNEDMVNLLLENGANVNQKDGRYGSALIAAAFTSRKTITRRLLRAGGDVFVSHQVHGDPLYQAVGQSDYAIAEMLLENAAWLTEDWGEICDLANEKNDSEIRSLLRQYDVREIHRRSLLAPSKSRSTDELDQSPSYSKILAAVFQKGIAVHPTSGSWKGRKGVAVTVAALNAGASSRILSLMRSAVGPVKALIDELRRIDEDQERDRQLAIDTGNLTIDVDAPENAHETSGKPRSSRSRSRVTYR